jgi:hypothetical protein
MKSAKHLIARPARGPSSFRRRARLLAGLPMRNSATLGLVVFSLLSSISAPAAAERYLVEVGTILVKHPTSFSIFGLTDERVPIGFSFEIDTARGAVFTVPAGTIVNAGTNTGFAVDLQLIPPAAVSNLNLTVGNTTWDSSEFLLQGLFTSGHTYAVLIAGSLSDGQLPQGETSGIRFQLVDQDTDNTIRFGTTTCDFTICSLLDFGTISSFSDRGSGTAADIRARITLLEKSPEEQLTDVIDSVTELPNLDSGNKNALNASLGGALDKLDPTQPGGADVYAAANKLDAFINKVEALRGKKLTDAEADDLIAEATAIKNRL